jgi:DNA ligase-1
MKLFAETVNAIDFTTKTTVKVEALVNYFDKASDSDKVWVIALFTHRRPKRAVKSTLLRIWVAELVDLPLWLVEDSYHIVGDLAETIAALVPETEATDVNLSLTEWFLLLREMLGMTEEQKKNKVLWAWKNLNKNEIFIFNKLITGGFRLGVSSNILATALGRHLGIEKVDVQFRIAGKWDPYLITFKELLSGDETKDLSKPYPFYLAYSLEESFFAKEVPYQWQAEWKWDGIRGQLIKRKGVVSLWSRGEELITERFPDIVSALPEYVDDYVLDGEIMVWQDGKPLPFQLLQTRIGRKKIGKKLLADAPAAFMCYDLLEIDGKDMRGRPMSERREQLELLYNRFGNQSNLLISKSLIFDSWDKLARLRDGSREKKAEGLMLKRKDSTYQSGRKRGDWYKWKLDPLTLDLVLIYAQRGHGRRANLYTDFTFAAQLGDQLVTLTKAYSGLTDKEFTEVNSFIRKNTIDTFGPVRSVKPLLVFEIAFEGINKSNRNKSGFALRFPRIVRWRRDKPIEEINTIDDVEMLWQEIEA